MSSISTYHLDIHGPFSVVSDIFFLLVFAVQLDIQENVSRVCGEI